MKTDEPLDSDTAQPLDDAHRQELRRKLEADLIEGLNSSASPMTQQDWDDIRRIGRERIRTETPGEPNSA